MEPLGDRALILRDLKRPAYEVASLLESAALPGVIEAVASYQTVGVYFDPALFEVASLLGFPLRWEREDEIAECAFEGTLHEVPVCYELGEDLEAVASNLVLTVGQVIELHTSTAYRCFAVGFCPGFPYLGYLPDKLCGIPRRSSPRVRTPVGAVAITGRQTGIYPLERPGGWAILGRTPLCLVDVESAYFPIKAGDEVCFKPIDLDEYHRLEGRRL